MHGIITEKNKKTNLSKDQGYITGNPEGKDILTLEGM